VPEDRVVEAELDGHEIPVRGRRGRADRQKCSPSMSGASA
jgi:hypothetical protein